MWRHSWLGFPALKSTSEVNEIILHELPSRRKFILHWNVAEDGENAFLYNTFCALHFSSLLNFFTQTIWTPLWEIKCKTIYFCCSHFPTWLTRTLPSWKTNFQTREVGASKEHQHAASETIPVLDFKHLPCFTVSSCSPSAGSGFMFSDCCGKRNVSCDAASK